MVLYETQITYKDVKKDTPGKKHLVVDKESSQPEKDWDSIIRMMNRRYGIKCDPEGRISVFFCGGTEGCLDAIFAHPIRESSKEQCIEYIKNSLEKEYSVHSVSFENIIEVSGKRFDFLGNKADDNGYIRNWYAETRGLGIDYFSNNNFKVEEYIEEKDFPTLSDAKSAACDIMADKSLSEELERIYSDDNEKKFYGNPVHYKINASGIKPAMDIIDTIVPALLANKRLCGKRILHINNISQRCYDEDAFGHLFESAGGNAVVIEMSGIDEDFGNYSSAYQSVVEYIDSIVSKNHMNTLCFFVEIKDRPGFSEKLLSKVCETIQIVTINEGYGNRDQAMTYLDKLVAKESFEMTAEEKNEALENKKMYSVEDIYDIYNKWYKNGLRTHFYRSYTNYRFESMLKEDKSSEPYDELRNMIGLTQVKELVDQIIDTAKIRKLRNNMGLSSQKSSLHMVFTGNPGSAKTTVARLIAQILRKEDVLDDGVFVECGRADLIAKYVGWTARTVRAKFREARGGILFIDEAYSLVDDTHSFADEAINTIVQEMENHREDVIVIFAGYPEKMKTFLDRNEGLRSRISFYLDFPDYNADELTDILKLMADKRGYKLDDGVAEKCRAIFADACAQNDFGNGRFVRNLIEQAEMAQAHRIASRSGGKRVGKKVLQTLTAEDFDVNISTNTKPQRVPMGFAV